MAKNDFKCAGSGTICEGEYGKINTAGSCRIIGNINCEEIKTAGSCHAKGKIICAGLISTAGSFHADEYVEAEEIKTAGSAHFNRNVKAKCFKTAGSTHIDGSIKADTIKAGGSFVCGGDCEAEDIEIYNPEVRGTVNGENVDIRISGGNAHIGTIVGGSVTVDMRMEGHIVSSFFSKKQSHYGSLTTESIEADEVRIAYTKVNRVTCRKAEIAPGCEIDLLEYSESADISPDAFVMNVHKI